jgi:hypothetical protein
MRHEILNDTFAQSYAHLSQSAVGHVAQVGVGQATFATDARPRSSRYPLILRRVAEGEIPVRLGGAAGWEHPPIFGFATALAVSAF